MIILATVPVARDIQKFFYNSVGREFFTYLVLFVICTGLIILLYILFFRWRAKDASQYIWLFICAGLYIYLTIHLRTYPEEAIHLLEYGLLSYLVFIALSHRIQDWTVYITGVLFVLFVGVLDEFLQWMMPRRLWDFRDIGFNTLASGIFLLAVWKGIKPKAIRRPVKKISVKMLVGIITVDMLFLGLCLSNTPDFVNYYTNALNTLSWLRTEEPMVEFGYKYRDSEIGTFYSRLTLEELREIDLANGKSYGAIFSKGTNSALSYERFIDVYNPYTNPFLYEFIIHLSRRDSNFKKLGEIDEGPKKIEISNVVIRENLLMEKYFGNTLRYSGLAWSDDKIDKLKKSASLWKGNYTSTSGMILTSFRQKTVWVTILITLIIIWTSGEFWKHRLDI